MMPRFGSDWEIRSKTPLMFKFISIHGAAWVSLTTFPPIGNLNMQALTDNENIFLYHVFFLESISLSYCVKLPLVPSISSFTDQSRNNLSSPRFDFNALNLRLFGSPPANGIHDIFFATTSLVDVDSFISQP